MANEMGTRRQHSTIIAVSPTRPSIIGRWRSSALERLVEVDQPGESEGDRNEAHERPVHDAEHVGGVPIAPDPVRLEPDQPGEEKHERRVQELDEALEPALRAGPEKTVDEIHGGVLIGKRDEWQPREDQHQQHQLGHFESAAQRAVEDVARHHVHHGQEHHGEKDDGGDHAQERIGAPLPPLLRSAHLPAATFFSSSRNSARILAASTPLALAFLIQSSTMGAERFWTSATKAGLALTILTPDFFSASRPFLSASSHEAPGRLAMCA